VPDEPNILNPEWAAISTMHFPDIAEHLDTGALLAITGPAAGKAFPADADVPFSDAVMRALEAEADAEAAAGGP
jgi:hypothetical protein